MDEYPSRMGAGAYDHGPSVDALVANAQEFKRTIYKMANGVVLDAKHTLVRSDLDQMCDGVITLAARIGALTEEREAAEHERAAMAATYGQWQHRAERAEAERDKALAALREARPYVFNRVTPANDTWRSQTATRVLARVDAALKQAEEGS